MAQTAKTTFLKKENTHIEAETIHAGIYLSSLIYFECAQPSVSLTWRTIQYFIQKVLC